MTGTIFDAMVANPAEVEVDGEKPRKIKLVQSKPLMVEVSYDKLDAESDGQKAVKNLPLTITYEGETIPGANIVKVNEGAVKPIPITVGGAVVGDDGFVTANAAVSLKTLAKHLNEGFNQFTVDVNGMTDVVMLDLEL